MNRPTLGEQIAISKMTDEECIKALLPQTSLGKIDFWLHNHCLLVWRIVHWNWFDTWEGSENADKYKSWDMKLKRRLFGGNKPYKQD